MKAILCILIFLNGFYLNGFSQGKPIETGQPLPAKPVQNPKCKDNLPDAVRILGWSPHVPFAIISKNEIKSAGSECCCEWATSKDIWYNINRWGKIVGVSKIKSGEGYDVTQCYELNLTTTEGDSGIGIFVSKNVNWELADSCKWEPQPEEIAKFKTFTNVLTRLVVDTTSFASFHSGEDSVLHEEMFFFKIPHPESDLPPTQCVVYGKRFLAIAYLNEAGEWILGYLRNEFTNSFGVYKPLAVIDVNRDGIAEIIFQEHIGHAWWDNLLQINTHTQLSDWAVKAVSVGGATL